MDEKFKELDAVTERKVCQKCARKRMYFCYDCHIYLPGISALAPTVELPYQVDIIKHKQEHNSKSTAIHCVLVSPDQTRLFSHDDLDIPDYGKELDKINTVLVFPDEKALSIDEFVKQSGRSVQRLLFLDATWGDAPKLRRLKQLENVPMVALNAYKTEYWRPQKGCTDEFLATVEAIYYTIKETWQAENPVAKYDGQFDDLLFWFKFFRSKYLTEYLDRRK